MKIKRCMNCGARLGDGVGIECNTLKHISIDLEAKLKIWLNKIVIEPADRICEACLTILKAAPKRLINNQICLGCGYELENDSSFVLSELDLEVCRSWLEKEMALKHLTKVCRPCKDRIEIFSVKTDYDFIDVSNFMSERVSVEMHSDSSVDKFEVKSEPDEECNIEDSELTDQTNQSTNVDGNTEQVDKDSCEEESVLTNDVKEDTDCIEYEYLESETPEAEDNANYGWTRSKCNGNDDTDDEYLPTYQPKRISEKVKEQYVNNIDLYKYKRTFRIGCCIFNGCKNECVSLIPRTVRRKMIMDHNLYIPHISRVCVEHLQDQNWEELLSNTTNNFTAEYCQDMKNIVRDACMTNLDFENIETVDAKLVRYWFDVNKSEFNRIYNQFPKLKRLKRPKTALALYLMHMQSTSIKRIALLVQLKEKTVKRNVTMVKDIVQCDSFRELKDLFLNDD